MRTGTFHWQWSAKQPVILGPKGEILGGQHRVIAALLAGIDLRTVPGQVYSIAIITDQHLIGLMYCRMCVSVTMRLMLSLEALNYGI